MVDKIWVLVLKYYDRHDIEKLGVFVYDKRPPEKVLSALIDEYGAWDYSLFFEWPDLPHKLVEADKH